MISSFIAVVVCTALCLSFDSTRWIGIIGVIFLTYVFPLITTTVLILVGGTYYYYKNHK